MKNNLRVIRERAGMTRGELARKSGVDRATIWSLEAGKRTLTTTKKLLRLADTLGTTVDDLFFG